MKAFMHDLKLINVNKVYNLLLDCCLLVAVLLFAIKPACLTNFIRIGKTRGKTRILPSRCDFESAYYAVACY